MPLHPQIQGLLSSLATAGVPAFNANPPAVTRQVYLGLTATLPPSQAKLRSVRDSTVPGPAGPIPVRIYTPEGAGPFPIVVYFHGGGFIIGDLNTHDVPCRDLAGGTGSVVIAIDYRLGPEHRFPAAHDDCYAATRWIGEHAAEFGGNGRLAVAGDSAGGNLSAITAIRLRDEGGPKLAAQLLIYPVTDNLDAGHPSMRDNAEGYLLSAADLQYMYGNYLNGKADESNPGFAPAKAKNLAGLPPALVLTAEFDPLRDEGEAFGKALKAAGVDVEIKRYDGAIHGFYQFAGALELGRQAVDHSNAWLKKKLA